MEVSSSSAPTSLLTRLPPELIDTLLTHVPPDQLQRTALSLLQVFPDYPPSSRHLWTHLVVHRSGQVMPLWKRLAEEEKKDGRGMIKHVETFCMKSWKGDADILNNALRCLPDIQVMLLNIGTNFSPDHLEEMFEEPRLGIRRLEMRFRPYVEQASYYQFLAGSYFDTSVETMYRRWPEVPSFTDLSIVQDLPPRMAAKPPALRVTAPTAVNSAVPSTTNSASASTAASLANSVIDLSLDSNSDSEHSVGGRDTPPTSVDSEPVVDKGYTGHGPLPFLGKMAWMKPKTFAQPIVFFDTKCLARFGASPVAANLTHLRLRVPSRDVAHVLVMSQTPGRASTLFPSLQYLDISTTNVRLDSVFAALLRSYERLEHLVLDRVNLFGFTAKDKGVELCRDLGGLCVSAGLNRGKERERAILAWDVAERTRFAKAEADRQRAAARQTQHAPQNDEELSEEDEAAATLRAAQAEAEERQRAIQLARSRRGHRSAATANFSLRDRPTRSSRMTASAASIDTDLQLPPPDRAYFVLPPLPTLKTVCIGGEAHNLSPAKVKEWEDDFHVGWRDGLGKVLGWATHVAEKYERAKKKADEWYASETGSVQKPSRGHPKGKAKAAALAPKVRPPTDIRLFRFPHSSEPRPFGDRSDPTSELIEVFPEGRDYLAGYADAIGDAELYATSYGNPAPCVLCTVPDCEGPARKGAEGERVDGRGGMSGNHKAGCGHLYGRRRWGWQQV